MHDMAFLYIEGKSPILDTMCGCEMVNYSLIFSTKHSAIFIKAVLYISILQLGKQ